MIQIKSPRLLITPVSDPKVFVTEMTRSHLTLQPALYGGGQVVFELRDDQCVWWMRDGTTQESVGGLAIHSIEASLGKYEIGYWLKPECCGRGFAREAVIALVEVLFEHYHARKLEIRCDSRNEPSIGLARALGFQAEAIWSRKDRGDGRERQSLVFARYDARGLPDLTSSPAS